MNNAKIAAENVDALMDEALEALDEVEVHAELLLDPKLDPDLTVQPKAMRRHLYKLKIAMMAARDEIRDLQRLLEPQPQPRPIAD